MLFQLLPYSSRVGLSIIFGFFENMRVEVTTAKDGGKLADLRVRAMKESLIAVGRFDPTRARARFLSDYCPEQTKIFYSSDILLGFRAICAARKSLIFKSQ